MFVRNQYFGIGWEEIVDKIWTFYDQALTQPQHDSGQWDGSNEHINLLDVWDTVAEAVRKAEE